MAALQEVSLGEAIRGPVPVAVPVPVQMVATLQRPQNPERAPIKPQVTVASEFRVQLQILQHITVVVAAAELVAMASCLVLEALEVEVLEVMVL